MYIKLLIIILLCCFVGGCATTNPALRSNPLYYEPDDVLIQIYKEGLEAQQQYPNLTYNPKATQEEINQLSDDDRTALIKMLRAEIARRIYNERIARRNKQNFLKRLASGIQGAMAGLSGKPTTQPPQTQTYTQSQNWQEYDAGYQKGYAVGYQYDESGMNSPIPPIRPTAPIPTAGKMTYEDGYTRGLLDGRQASQQGKP